MLRVALAIAALLFGGLAGAAPKASDELLSAFQTRLETNAPFDDLLEQMSELEPAELTKIQADFDKVWPRLRDGYLAAFEQEAKDQHSGDLRKENQKLIRSLRADFHQVRGMPEGPMKDALKKTSMPALNQLRELLLPTADRILNIAGENLRGQRSQILKLATFRDGILKAAVSVEPPETVKKIKVAEFGVAEELSDLDRNDLRIIAKNHKIAEQAMVPENERIGIEDANIMRVLVGLPALVLDPKLCDAARGHSEDMTKLKFFDHTSPVPGKRSPSDRARKAGTSGGGENIFAGSANPKSANKGWFFSPGHHKNMFNPGYGRIGLGGYGSKWTQMFGR